MCLSITHHPQPTRGPPAAHPRPTRGPHSAGKLKTIGLGDMLMLWDGNVMYVLFEAGSEAVLSSE